jgi:hypothetical protein
MEISFCVPSIRYIYEVGASVRPACPLELDRTLVASASLIVIEQRAGEEKILFQISSIDWGCDAAQTTVAVTWQQQHATISD